MCAVPVGVWLLPRVAAGLCVPAHEHVCDTSFVSEAAILGAEPGVTAGSPLVSSTFFWGQERRRGDQRPPCQWSRWACDHVRGLQLSLLPLRAAPRGGHLCPPGLGPRSPPEPADPQPRPGEGAWHVWEWMCVFTHSLLLLFLFLLKMFFLETELVDSIM